MIDLITNQTGTVGTMFLSPAMAKPLGGHINAGGPSVCLSVTKLVSAMTSDCMQFDPVMHPTIALNEFEDG